MERFDNRMNQRLSLQGSQQECTANLWADSSASLNEIHEVPGGDKQASQLDARLQERIDLMLASNIKQENLNGAVKKHLRSYVHALPEREQEIVRQAVNAEISKGQDQIGEKRHQVLLALQGMLQVAPVQHNKRIQQKLLTATLSMEYPFGKPCTYVGEVSKGMAHGKGRLTYSDGSSWEGNFINGEPSGKGRLENFDFGNGSWYRGEAIKLIPQGQGEFHFPNGAVYRGEMASGMVVGIGKVEKYFYNETGKYGNSCYTGPIWNFCPHGYGYKLFENGMEYRGNFESGKMKGKGFVINQHDYSKTGGLLGTYTGSVLGFQRHGDGTYTNRRGQFPVVHIKGIFHTGQSEITLKDGTPLKVDGLIRGVGVFDNGRRIARQNYQDNFLYDVETGALHEALHVHTTNEGNYIQKHFSGYISGTPVNIKASFINPGDELNSPVYPYKDATLDDKSDFINSLLLIKDRQATHAVIDRTPLTRGEWECILEAEPLRHCILHIFDRYHSETCLIDKAQKKIYLMPDKAWDEDLLVQCLANETRNLPTDYQLVIPAVQAYGEVRLQNDRVSCRHMALQYTKKLEKMLRNDERFHEIQLADLRQLSNKTNAEEAGQGNAVYSGKLPATGKLLKDLSDAQGIYLMPKRLYGISQKLEPLTLNEVLAKRAFNGAQYMTDTVPGQKEKRDRWEADFHGGVLSSSTEGKYEHAVAFVSRTKFRAEYLKKTSHIREAIQHNIDLAKENNDHSLLLDALADAFIHLGALPRKHWQVNDEDLIRRINERLNKFDGMNDSLSIMIGLLRLEEFYKGLDKDDEVADRIRLFWNLINAEKLVLNSFDENFHNDLLFKEIAEKLVTDGLIDKWLKKIADDRKSSDEGLAFNADTKLFFSKSSESASQGGESGNRPAIS